MIASGIQDWLEMNQHAGSKAYVISHQHETRIWLDRLGLAPDSELGFFYLNYGATSVRGWYELNEIDQIQDSTDYVHRELDVPKEYLALTSIEGQGVVLYHRGTQAVQDVAFGQFDDLMAGSLDPVADSFCGFLSWCKAKSEAA